MPTRFAMRRDPIWVPLLVPFGATASRSFAEIDGDALDVRFGFLFHERIPLAEIEQAEPIDWNLLRGIGWRTNLVDRVGLIGSTEGVVCLSLRAPRRMTMPLPVSCRALSISLADRDGFLSALATAQKQSGALS